jgi:hypothetical protein
MNPEPENSETTIMVSVRSARPPYDTWKEEGYDPFEVHGEQFAITRNIGALDSPNRWRVSHVNLGCALPNTSAPTKAEAKDAAIAVLNHIGPDKLSEALATARQIISSVQLHP